MSINKKKMVSIILGIGVLLLFFGAYRLHVFTLKMRLSTELPPVISQILSAEEVVKREFGRYLSCSSSVEFKEKLGIDLSYLTYHSYEITVSDSGESFLLVITATKPLRDSKVGEKLMVHSDGRAWTEPKECGLSFYLQVLDKE